MALRCEEDCENCRYYQEYMRKDGTMWKYCNLHQLEWND